MSNNAINVRQRFIDSAGNPRANGYVYFYNNKTTDLASIYADELLTVAQSNPYRLNANGEIEGDVKYSGKLTLTVTNSDGSDSITDDDVTSQGGTGTEVFANQFKTTETSPASMAVIVQTGKVLDGETLVSIANQTTTVITAPVANPRIDRIVVDRLTGVYSIITGSESATPTAPAIPVNKAPSAQIALQTSTTSIIDALITDERIPGVIESNVNSTETLANKTLTLPKINDTSADNQYVFTVSELAANRNVNLPLLAGNDEFTFNDHIQTLTNKTLTSPALTSPVLTTPQINDTSSDHQYIVNPSELLADRTVTLPLLTGNDEFTFNAHSQTLTNKTIGDTNIITAQDDAFTIADSSDATLFIDFNAAGTTGTKTTIASSQTSNKVVTLPDATDTLVGKSTTDTLTNKTIGDTNVINAQDDAFTIDDAVDGTIQIGFDAAGTTATKTTIASSQTTNKTITLPDATDTLVGKATTDTLTNKSVSLTSNTISGTTAQFNAALSDNDFATLAGTESLTNKTIGDTNVINAQDDAFSIADAVNPTLLINFDVVGSTGTTTTIKTGQTANRTLTLPDATDVIVARTTTETLSNKTLASPVCTGTTTVATLQNATSTLNGGYYIADTTSTYLGSTALDSLTTGTSCTAVGSNSQTTNSTGLRNTSYGASSMENAPSPSDCIGIGYQSLNYASGSGNIGVGNNTLDATTFSGNFNTAVGNGSGTGTTTGALNSFFGKSTGAAVTTGSNNIFIGSDCGSSVTTGSNNCATGSNALFSVTTSGNNSAYGYAALFNNTSANNSAFGYNAAVANTSGTEISAFGYSALYSNTTGTNNSAFGYNALYSNTTGINNSAFGYNALYSNTTGTNNSAFGRGALGSSTGANNTAIGYAAGGSTTTGTNVTLVGYNAQATASTTSNEITLGDANVTTLRCATTTITAISDERDKENIQDLEQGLDFVNAVRSVSYDWNMRGTDRKGPDTGFTAQQLQEVQKQHGYIPGLVHDENPDRLEVGYGKLIPVMVKAIQELTSKVENLENELSKYKGQDNE